MKLELIIFLILTYEIFGQGLNLDPNCGLRKTSSPEIKPVLNRTQIVGGNEAAKGDWGWQVLLSYFDYRIRFICGGSLINDQWVITAAHCVKSSSNPKNYLVDVGVHNRFSPDNWTLPDLKVSKVIKNPNYDENTLFNDLALIKLKEPILLDSKEKKIIPVCIPTSSSRFQGKFGYATGWGDLYFDMNQGSEVLEEVLLPIYSDDKCLHTMYEIDQKTQICAGSKDVDTCQGDSGGPLVAKSDIDHRWYLVGLTSFGEGCGTNPGVYTRVSAFQEWITTTIDNN